MGQTRYFDLAFFDFGDNLSSGINVQKEIDRFVVIDKQLYGLYNVFGNGVINGWTVKDAGFQDEDGISVSVGAGVGVINYIASETSLPGYIYNLPPNSLINIYATLSGTTSLTRIINFIFSITNITSENVIRIARVSTGANSILYIDNTVRDLIGFEQIIQDTIDVHKHTGTPSKIDLENETKNQLPGARIEGIDASKVTSGQFDIDRIPLIDHNGLENNGMLSHAALDSFVKTFSQNNKELFGEVSTVNLLKMIIFHKYKDADVDEHFINEIALIPGISPNEFIDFDASTANINLTDKCISGVPAQSGLFTSVYWNNTFSFNTYTYKDKILIENDTLSIDRSSEIIDPITDFSDDLCFDPETKIVADNTECVVATEDGNRLGRMGGGGTLNYFYRKNLTESRNWDGIYDELVIKVKTDEEIHTPLYMYVVNGSNISTVNSGQFGSIEEGDIDGVQKPSIPWTLLSQDESMPSFEEKVFSISSLSLTEVSQIVIYTGDDFIFDIDDIFVRKTNLLAENGIIRFRYQTEANVVFHSVFYDAEVPDDTSVSIRVKTSSSPDLLPRSSYSLPLNSGDILALTGNSSEIEVVLTSNSERSLSSVINSIELRLLVNADFTGFVINTETEWNRGTLSNISTQDSTSGDSQLIVSSPINVGGRYFSKSGSVSEINDENIGVYGFSGNLMPVSPNQARNWSSISSRGFSTVSSVVRKFNNNFLVTDVNNNRVLEVDSDGNMVKGFGSTYSIDSTFYPLSSIYNSVAKILTIVFTKAAVVSDITKIAFYIGSTKVSLTTNETILQNNKAGNKVLEILLDDDTAVRLVGVTSDLSVNFDAGAFTEEVTVQSGMTVQGNSIFSALRGLMCYIGDFTYIDNIRHPVFMNEINNNNWIIANSSIFYGEIDEEKEEEADVPDIIEIDPEDISDTEDKLISTAIKFSDYSLGSIVEYDDNRFIVAGIKSSDSTIGSSITGDDLLGEYSDSETIPENVQFRASAIDDLAGYAGVVMVIDKANNKSQVLYPSPDRLYPSSLDQYENGDISVSESSFFANSGRIIRIDAFGNIVNQHSSGIFNVITSVRVLNDDKLIVSV